MSYAERRRRKARRGRGWHCADPACGRKIPHGLVLRGLAGGRSIPYRMLHAGCNPPPGGWPAYNFAGWPE